MMWPSEVSCGNGHLEMAQWLTEHFHLTDSDARISDNSAFRYSCGNGHLGWLNG
jgi:hypothetical protein